MRRAIGSNARRTCNGATRERCVPAMLSVGSIETARFPGFWGQKLVGCEAAADAGAYGEATQLARVAAADHGRPRVGPLRTQMRAPTGSLTRTSSHGSRCSRPSGPCRLRCVCRLSSPDVHAAARCVKVAFCEGERLADSQSGTPQQYDERPRSQTLRRVARAPHNGDDLLDAGRTGRVAQTLVSWRTTAVVTGRRGRERRRPAASRRTRPVIRCSLARRRCAAAHERLQSGAQHGDARWFAKEAVPHRSTSRLLFTPGDRRSGQALIGRDRHGS